MTVSSLKTFTQADGTINLTTASGKQAGTIEYEDGVFSFYPPKTLQAHAAYRKLAAAEYAALAWAIDNLTD